MIWIDMDSNGLQRKPVSNDNNNNIYKKYPTEKRLAMREYKIQKINLHSRQTSTRNEHMLTRSTDRITKGKATLIQKDQSKGTAPNNYRPIFCLLMMWKLLTTQIREEIYNPLTGCELFPEEQKVTAKDPEAQQNDFT